jgi:hypothetical protein
MNIGPRAPALNKANGAPRKPCGTDHRCHFPKPHVGVGNHDPSPRLQSRQRLARHHRVRVSRARGVESVLATNDKMPIRFQMHETVSRCQQSSQRALAAARQAAQHDTIERDACRPRAKGVVELAAKFLLSYQKFTTNDSRNERDSIGW